MAGIIEDRAAALDPGPQLFPTLASRRKFFLRDALLFCVDVDLFDLDDEAVCILMADVVTVEAFDIVVDDL